MTKHGPTSSLCKTSDGELAGGIRRKQGFSQLSRNGARANNPPSASLFDHLLCCILVAQESAARIDSHDPIPLLYLGCGIPTCQLELQDVGECGALEINGDSPMTPAFATSCGRFV